MSDKKMQEAFADFERIHQLAKRAAARIARTLDLPPWLEFEDLVQEGLRIACEAVNRWDPNRVRFSTYLFLHLDTFLRRAVQRQLPTRFECPLSEKDLDLLECKEDSFHNLELDDTVHTLMIRLKEEAPIAFEVIIRFFGLEGQQMQSLSSIERHMRLRRGEGKQLLNEGLSRLRQILQEELGYPN